MGLGAFACGVGGAKKAFGAFGAFGGFDGWQTAGLNANKKLLIYGPWCLCLRGCGSKKAFGGFGAFGGFDGWQTAGLNANKKLFDTWALVPLPAGLGVPKRRLERLECLEGLTAGKRQA